MDFVVIAVFFLGLFALVKGADLIVDSAARIARQFGISDFIIGLTIVAVGTSLPELATGITAALYGNTDLIVGNVVGSNIANLGWNLGLSGLLALVVIDKSIYKRDGFIMLLTVLVFYLFSLNGLISRWEGVFLLWLFISYILFFLTMKKRFKREFHFSQYLSEFVGVKKDFPLSAYSGFDYYSYKKILAGLFNELKKMFKSASGAVAKQSHTIQYFLKQGFFFSAGVVGVVFGADFLVKSVSAFPLPPIVIGLVFVSIGTTLPELAVSLSAIRKKYQNIMVGNIIGSNIANILLVASLSAIVRPLVIPAEAIGIYIPFLFLLTWLFLVFSRNDYKVNRIEALTMLLLYVGFVCYLFFGLHLGGMA